VYDTSWFSLEYKPNRYIFPEGLFHLSSIRDEIAHRVNDKHSDKFVEMCLSSVAKFIDRDDIVYRRLT